jgi:hypothetical protein
VVGNLAGRPKSARQQRCKDRGKSGTEDEEAIESVKVFLFFGGGGRGWV